MNSGNLNHGLCAGCPNQACAGPADEDYGGFVNNDKCKKVGAVYNMPSPLSFCLALFNNDAEKPCEAALRGCVMGCFRLHLTTYILGKLMDMLKKIGTEAAKRLIQLLEGAGMIKGLFTGDWWSIIQAVLSFIGLASIAAAMAVYDIGACLLCCNTSDQICDNYASVKSCVLQDGKTHAYWKDGAKEGGVCLTGPAGQTT